MTIQVHEPHPGRLHGHSQRRRHLSRSRLVLASVTLLLVVGIALVVLTILQFIQGPWILLIPVVFTGFGLVFTSLQWLFPVDPSITTSTSYPDIIRQYPPIDALTIPRERTVAELYEKVSNRTISATVMRGINGVGKTTLANLLCRYAEKKSSKGEGPFADKALWVYIDPHFTFSDLAEFFSLALKKPLPNLNGLSPQYQAEQLIKMINSAKTRRLIIMDFKNPVDGQLESALTDHPSFKEWLKALNSQPCTCSILFTGCPWSPNSSGYLPNYLREYSIEGLNIAEGIELLQSGGIEATVDELRSVVQRCDGHPGALNLLITLLNDRSLNLANFIDDLALMQIWIKEIDNTYFEHIFERLDPVQQKLLLAFSVYRRPVPIEAAHAVINEVPRVDLLVALPRLIKKHLLRTAQEKNNYQLHPIVTDYALIIFNNSNIQGHPTALLAAHLKAAEYYQKTVNDHSLGLRRNKDNEFLTEAAWHLLKAEQDQEAYALIQRANLLRYLFEKRC